MRRERNVYYVLIRLYRYIGICIGLYVEKKICTYIAEEFLTIDKAEMKKRKNEEKKVNRQMVFEREKRYIRLLQVSSFGFYKTHFPILRKPTGTGGGHILLAGEQIKALKCEIYKRSNSRTRTSVCGCPVKRKLDEEQSILRLCGHFFPNFCVGIGGCRKGNIA